MTILIADDNPKNLELLHSLLNDKGYRIRIARNGVQAIESIRLDPPDLVLLDVHMPKMDGYEVCKEMKNDSGLKEIPVIFVSALDEIFNKVEAFNAGGVDYISKPIQAEEVLARVNTHIELYYQRKQLSSTLQKLQSTQAELVRKEKLASLGTLIAGISHNLNNPVNYIKSSLEPLKRDVQDLLEIAQFCEQNITQSSEVIEELNEKKEKFEFNLICEEITQLLDNIITGTDKIEMIGKELKYFNKNLEPHKTSYQITEGIRKALDLFEEQILKNSIEVVENYTSESSISGHSSQLDHLFFSLISNSIEALERKTEGLKKLVIDSSVSSEEIGAHAVITIEDNGTGIPATELRKIYDPFYTTKEIGKGSGLGLSIAHQVINEHKGHIDLQSSDTGTVVTLKLPLQDNAI